MRPDAEGALDPGWVDLDELFAAQGERLFEALYVVVGGTRDAERILQHAFMRQWERQARHESIGDPVIELFDEAMGGLRMRRWRAVAAIRLRLGRRRDTFDETGLDVEARDRLMGLSPRARAVLALLAKGFSVDQTTDIVRARDVSAVERLARDGQRLLAPDDRDPDARVRAILQAAMTRVTLDPHAADRQRARRRRVVRERRLGAAATIGLLAVGVGAFALTRPPSSTPAVAASSSPTTTSHPARLLPTIVPLHARWKPIVGLPSDAVMLSLSADGRHIAYARFGSGLRACRGCTDVDGIGTLRADGIGRVRPIEVPLDNGAPMMPAWSPDGRTLAFVRDRQIWLVDLRAARRGDADAVRRLTGGVDPRSPTFSPDGRTIAYVDDGKARFHNAGLSQLPQIFSVRLDGSHKEQLTHDPVSAGSPSFSPDGRRIAYSRDGWIVLMSAGGSDPTLLTRGVSPRWSPDGTKIALIWFAGPTVQAPDLLYPEAPSEQPLGSVRILTVRTRAIRDLGVDTLGPYGSVSWTPDGRAVLVNLYAPPRVASPS